MSKSPDHRKKEKELFELRRKLRSAHGVNRNEIKKQIHSIETELGIKQETT